ncbi:hypothetical protein AVEN_258583-1 [Araneus ventricosus]|uniref:Uncharacterized protein n=1 Tax=Araneus ventricosus TaxID=182803 RepID=A0A4Y2RLK4_ARAVE|nr:hypothetical protein AVEN_258583-1 [Araneus ventricosus]
MSSSSLSEEDAIEYNMSEDLEDSPAVISPPPSSKPGKANKYRNRLHQTEPNLLFGLHSPTERILQQDMKHSEVEVC